MRPSHYVPPFHGYWSVSYCLLAPAKISPQVTTMLQWRTENDQQMNKQASCKLQILTGKRAANKQLLTSMLQLRLAILTRRTLPRKGSFVMNPFHIIPIKSVSFTGEKINFHGRNFNIILVFYLFDSNES